MSNDLLAFGGLCWLVAAALGLAGAQVRLARAILGLGGVAAIAATLSALPGGTTRFQRRWG